MEKNCLSKRNCRISGRKLITYFELLFLSRFELTRHTDTAEGTRIVKAGAVVSARNGLAFVDVGLASWPGEALSAVASERAGRVDADPVVLTRRTYCTQPQRKSLLTHKHFFFANIEGRR